MNRCLLLLPALLLVAAADPAVERAARKERAKLLGTWMMVPPSYLKPDEVLLGGIVIFEITADKINVSLLRLKDKKMVREAQDTLTFTLDPTQTPKTIDLTPSAGDNKGKVQPCIYELNGDELKLRMPIARNKEDARPTKFDINTSDFRRTTADKIAVYMSSMENCRRNGARSPLARQHRAWRSRSMPAPSAGADGRGEWRL